MGRAAGGELNDWKVTSLAEEEEMPETLLVARERLAEAESEVLSLRTVEDWLLKELKRGSSGVVERE